jgi:hypothetical protein
MPQQRFYEEEEAREILGLAGVGPSRPNSFSVLELQNAAAELNIQPEVIQQAIQDTMALRDDASDRREFRRKKLREVFSVLGIGAAFLGLDSLLFHHFDRNLLCILMIWPVVATYKYIFYRSTEYEKQFLKWRFERTLRVAPGALAPIIDSAFEECLNSFSCVTPDHLAMEAVKALNITRPEAVKVVNNFVERHPEFATRLAETAPPKIS